MRILSVAYLLGVIPDESFYLTCLGHHEWAQIVIWMDQQEFMDKCLAGHISQKKKSL